LCKYYLLKTAISFNNVYFGSMYLGARNLHFKSNLLPLSNKVELIVFVSHDIFWVF